MVARVLILGCGYAGAAFARLARERGAEVLTTVRSEARARALEAEGFRVLVAPELDGGVAHHVDTQTHVLIAFPPDGTTDARIAEAVASAAAVTYLSSTSVYGERSGRIDDTVALPETPSASETRRLEAEAVHRLYGATTLRCPGIYGPERGLHRRIIAGQHRIPGDGSRTLSRIHVEDLASFIWASRDVKGETFVLGDLEPAAHIEVVRFVCSSYGVPLPQSVPLSEVPVSLRADRRVDAWRALQALGVTLRYPSFRQGMAPDATRGS
ncbi:MAG TPA: NAD-dependent epimerase/dehydratase family protein [Polyangiaceae bacterium]|nr:NAD-dependent epimerase/dehydratase family protein [Polyangiaceae bacterium]